MLPAFRRVDPILAEHYARRVLAHGDSTMFCALEPLPEGGFRAIFRLAYFTLAEGATEPSKSQWNTLKKRMRRVNPGVFVYKEHGPADCPEGCAEPCGYVAFGYFAERREAPSQAEDAP